MSVSLSSRPRAPLAWLVTGLLLVTGLTVGAHLDEAHADPLPPGRVLASDAFDRLASSSWGTAPTGGQWTVSGAPWGASVDGDQGLLRVPGPMTTHAELRSVSSTAARVTTEFSVDKLHAGAGEGYYVAATARQRGADAYSGRLVVRPDGSVRLLLLRNYQNLAASVVVPGVTIRPGTRYSLSVEATGVSPTTVSAKVWPSSASEPAQWQVRGTDAHEPLQRAGHVGLFAFVPGSSTNAPVTVRFARFSAAEGGMPLLPAPPPPAPPRPPSNGTPDLGPVSFPSVQAMRSSGMFRIPDDARLVEWNHGNRTLEEVFMTLRANDILVLPERRDPYLIDSSGGFRAAGVSAVSGPDGSRVPIASRYQGRDARTWFAMARAQRGVIGLGPGAVIAPSDSGFRQQAQIEDKGSPLPGGGTSPGRYWWNTAGVRQYELVGAQEKVLETVQPNAYLANFTMRGRDFGGVAYSAIGMRGGTAERLDLDAAWRGFSGGPNGETAALTISNGRYLVSRVTMRAADPAGRRVGTSPLMVNSSPGGRWEHGEASQSRFGMPTIWRSSGRHEWSHVNSRWNGSGVNIEMAQDGFEFVMTGGSLWPNRHNQGGRPAPDGVAGAGLHIGLNAVGRASVRLVDVDLDRNVQPGALCVQLYGGTDPKKVSVSATQRGGVVPVAAYGVGGLVRLG